MMSGNFKTALASLRESRWRTTFTMLGIIIGITSVVTVVSLGEGLKQQIGGQINQLGPNVLTVRPGKVSSAGLSSLYSFMNPSTLSPDDVDTIKGLPIVSQAAPIEFVGSSVKIGNSEADNVFVAGTTSALADILHQNIAYGDFFSDSTGFQNNFAMVGSNVANDLFNEINPVGSTLQINGQDFVVHGVFAASNGSLLSLSQSDLNSSIFIPTQAAESLSSGHANILQIFAKLKPGVNADNAVNQINRALSQNHGGMHDFTVLKHSQLMGESDHLVNTATGFIGGIAAISLVVGGIGIMNILLVSVSERTREIGIRKAIGATNRQILNQFFAEGLVLSIGGGIIGIGVSYLINLLLRLYSTWKPIISLPVLFLAVSVSVVAGVVFSLAPAFKAARKDPITALRGN